MPQAAPLQGTICAPCPSRRQQLHQIRVCGHRIQRRESPWAHNPTAGMPAAKSRARAPAHAHIEEEHRTKEQLHQIVDTTAQRWSERRTPRIERRRKGPRPRRQNSASAGRRTRGRARGRICAGERRGRGSGGGDRRSGHRVAGFASPAVGSCQRQGRWWWPLNAATPTQAAGGERGGARGWEAARLDVARDARA